MITVMERKIKAQKEWPFFLAFHDTSYILSHDCKKKVSLHELGETRTYILHNNSAKEIVVYKIDGGLIKDNNVLKCDNGILTEDDWLFLIELKGADLNHALDQINSTIDILLKRPNKIVKKLNVRIVLSKVSIPRISASKENKLKQLLFKHYGGGCYKKQSRILEDIL